MNLFPMFVKLLGRQVVVVGGGEIAAGKIDGLLKAGAKVRLIAPQVHLSLVNLIRTREIEWIPREFIAGDLDGAALAIAATSAPGVNTSVFQGGTGRPKCQVRRHLAISSDVAFANAGALGDPIVRGVHHAREVVIGHDPGRQVTTAANDNRTHDAHEAAPPTIRARLSLRPRLLNVSLIFANSS